MRNILGKMRHYANVERDRVDTMPNEQRIRLHSQPQGTQGAQQIDRQPVPTQRYSNPQSTQDPAQLRQPRRAGQGQLYKQYVPAQGDEPPQLRHQVGEWLTPIEPEASVPQTAPKSRGKKTAVVILGIIAIVAISLGGAIVLRGILHPDEPAGASTTTDGSDQSPFDVSADNAVDFLTANKSATDEDMMMLTTLFPSLTDKYEILSQIDPNTMSPDAVISRVSTGGWEPELTGWPNLQLRVRAGEYATMILRERYGDEYEVSSMEIPNVTTSDQPPMSVMLVCKGISGAHVGVMLNVTVGMTGATPTVVDNLDAALSQKKGVLDRLDAVIALHDDLYVGDFALEGYTVPQRNEDGSSTRTESWWLYVNSNVAPTDLNDFVAFVNTMLESFQQTAGSDVVTIDLTVISCDTTDPAMGQRTFTDLAAELATTSDHGGFYMNFDYPLRGEATTTTPCRVEDLDGRLHPYVWETPETP